MWRQIGTKILLTQNGHKQAKKGKFKQVGEKRFLNKYFELFLWANDMLVSVF